MTKRADKKRNIDKVAAAVIKNPLATEREIAKKTGLGQKTVNRAKKELTQIDSKDDRIINLTDSDYEIQKLIIAKKLKKLKENPDSITDSDINQWDRHSMTRFMLFRGEITDPQGGLKEMSTDTIKGMAEEAVDNKLKELLN